MSAFESTLRGQVDSAWATLTIAREAGHAYEAHLHGARIQDLLALATRHGIRTTGWVDEALLASSRLGS